MKLANNHRQPIPLDGGTILAAAGTPGSTKEVAAEDITDRDRRRHIDSGRVVILDEVPQVEVAPQREARRTPRIERVEEVQQ